MANIVQNAVGTQRQFTRQPVATYQKSLRNLVDSQGIVKSGAGDRLYNALTGLGSNIMKYASSEEDRARARTVEVEPLINAATEDDWKKLSAIELLNKYGQFQLADNPYAVAAIEQARGKYMSEKFNQQYQITMANDPVKEPDKERERYDSEKRKFLEDNKSDSYDVEQFYKGFWESNPKDLLDITNQKVAEKSKSLDTIRRATLQADGTSYVAENADKSPEEYAQGLQQLALKSVLMSYQPDVRKSYFEGILEETAKETGSPDKIRACGDIVITNNEDGTKPIHVKDVIDMNTYIRMAEDTAMAKPNEWMNKQYEAMANCDTVEQLDKWWNALPKEAQHMLRPKYGQQRVALVKAVKIKKEQMIRANKKQLAANAKSQNANVALIRYLNHKADNTYCTADEAYGAAMRQLAGVQPGDTNTFARIMFWSPNSRMRSEYKGYFENSILGSSASEMADAGDMKSVTTALGLYKNNPALFETTFGKSLTDNLQTIQALMDFQGSEEAGFEMFCKGRDAMASDSTVAQAAKDFADNAMSNGYTVALKNADSDKHEMVDVSISNDSFAKVNATALQYIRACSGSEDAANHILSSVLANNYVEYDGHPLPVAVFAPKTEDTNGIDASSDQLGAATEYMDARVEETNAEYVGMNATWWWGVDHKIHFGDPVYGLDEHDGYTPDEFYDLVNQWHYDRQAAEEEEAEEADSNDDDSSTNSNSSDSEGEGSRVTVTGNRRAYYGGVSWNGY